MSTTSHRTNGLWRVSSSIAARLDAMCDDSMINHEIIIHSLVWCGDPRRNTQLLLTDTLSLSEWVSLVTAADRAEEVLLNLSLLDSKVTIPPRIGAIMT